jgi:hypothetical protein
MLNYSELTIVNNSEGMPTALGYPINSILLQNNKPLFVGGGGKKTKANGKANGNAKGKDYEPDFTQLAVPAGLVCMTQTICTNTSSNYVEPEIETIPEGLYEQLLALAESKVPKKLTKRNGPHGKKHKTKRNNK